MASVTDALAPELAARIRAYVLEHGDDLGFTKYFWRGCEPLEVDVIQYHKFARAHELASRESSRDWIADELEVSPSTVGTWLTFSQMPKFAHYLASYLRLGQPEENTCWLTLRCTHGYAIPIGPWIQAPLEVRRWEDLRKAYEQIPHASVSDRTRDLDIGFFLGMMVGDAAKSKTGHGHRHVDLILSKEYETNMLIGEYTCDAASSLGLKMHRVADIARPANKPNGFYCWVSEASPLIDWIYNVCLGLQDTEKTTYDPVRMDWAIEAPVDFRRGFLQGIAESDGSVSIASQTVELWVEPSRDLISKLLMTFGVRSFNNRQALSITKSQVKKAFDIPLFSPSIKTVRYAKLERLASAFHVQRGKRIPREVRTFISARALIGQTVPSISQSVLKEFGLALSFETVQRWARRAGMTV